MSLPKEFEECGFIYWDFLRGKRGNPFPVVPTARMVTSYEIREYSYHEYVPSPRKKEKGEFLPPVTIEIYYDREYVITYREKFRDVYDVLMMLEDSAIVKQADSFIEFETLNGIVPSIKNPRHSLYIKYKESRNNA